MPRNNLGNVKCLKIFLKVVYLTVYSNNMIWKFPSLQLRFVCSPSTVKYDEITIIIYSVILMIKLPLQLWPIISEFRGLQN